MQRVTCYGDTEEAAYGSRRERGPLLVDPQERYRARVESEALAYPEDAGGGQPHCLNRSRLYLVRDGEEEEIVLALAPFDGMTGNAIRLVDWSPDGERLLLETSLWTYNAEFENPDILVLHAAQGVIEALDLQGAVARQFGADCHLAWRGLGFTAEGAVAVETLPAGELFGPSCESHASQWRLDTRQRLHRLPVDLPVATYGRHQARAGHP